VIVLYNFLEFNVVKNLAHCKFLLFEFILTHFKVYGTQPWHWYFSQGLPVILLSYTPLFFWINFVNKTYRDNYWKLNVVIFFSITCYSFQTHKEFRFIYPILPLCFISLADYTTRQFIKPTQPSLSTNETKQHGRGFMVLLAILFLVQVGATVYFSRMHQRGPMDAVQHLRSEYYHKDNSKQNQVVVYFLMPCHQAPGYAFVHPRDDGLVWQGVHLDCSPFEGNHSETDRFYDNPTKYIESEQVMQRADYLVMYNSMSEQIVSVIEKAFTIQKVFFHMHMTHDGRMSANVHVWKKR